MNLNIVSPYLVVQPTTLLFLSTNWYSWLYKYFCRKIVAWLPNKKTFAFVLIKANRIQILHKICLENATLSIISIDILALCSSKVSKSKIILPYLRIMQTYTNLVFYNPQGLETKVLLLPHVCTYLRESKNDSFSLKHGFTYSISQCIHYWKQ